MKIKVGDQVKILAGKDKGKTGKVIATLKKEEKVVVEGINIVKKHQKPTNNNDKGGIIEMAAPIHVSNVKKIENTKTEKTTKKTEEVKPVKKETKTKKATKKEEE